jgi:TolA-binding protein
LYPFARDASAALLVLLGCAGGGAGARQELDALRAEIRAVRQDNETLTRKVDALSGRVEVVASRLTRAPTPEPASSAPASAALAPLVPPDLAVVKMAPRAARVAPPVATAIPIAEPDAQRLDALALRTGRELAAEADRELALSRRRAGVDRAHALEDFAARYPRHPSADNALAEAAAAYAAAEIEPAACALARRAADDYPAGDAMSDVLERLAWCESRRGGADAERRLLERLVADYPKTPAAARAGTRLAEVK